MEASLIKTHFLKKLGIDLNNIPEEFKKYSSSYERCVSEDERNFLYSNAYTSTFIMPFSLKDICGTRHPSYEDMTFLESFIKLKRGDISVKAFYNNPNYYSGTLRSKEQSKASHDTSIELNRTSDGKCYINGGNNRIGTIMMVYLAEMSKATTQEERDAIDKKYTFYGEVRSLPRNKDVYNSIFLLNEIYRDQIQFKFKGNNPDDCHYEVILSDQLFEITSAEGLKTMLKQAYSLNDVKEDQELFSKLERIVCDYASAVQLSNDGKVKLIKEICPNIEKIKSIYVHLRSLNSSRNIFKGCHLENINFDNIENVMNATLEKIKEEMKLAEIENLKGKMSIFSSIEELQIGILSVQKTCKKYSLNPDDIMSNFSSFVDYLNIGGNISITEPISYQKLYDMVLNNTIAIKSHELDTARQQMKMYSIAFSSVEKQYKVVSSQNKYEQLKEQNNVLSADRVEKEKQLYFQRLDKDELEEKKNRTVQEKETLEKKHKIIKIFKRKTLRAIHDSLTQISDSIKAKDLSINELKSSINSINTQIQNACSNFLKDADLNLSISEYENILAECKRNGVTADALIQKSEEWKMAMDALNVSSKEKELRNILQKNGMQVGVSIAEETLQYPTEINNRKSK